MKKTGTIGILAGLMVVIAACSKGGGPIACLPPPSDDVFISLEDSLGNDLISLEYPNLTLNVTDNNGTQFVNSLDLSDGTVTKRAWNFSVEDMQSGYPYLLFYDSLHVDTITVDWVTASTVCDGTTYYRRSVNSITYNDSVFVGGGWHTYIK